VNYSPWLVSVRLPEGDSYVSLKIKYKGVTMIITAICPECGDIIEEQECRSHPDTSLIVYESKNEAFVGEAIEDYLYGGNNV